MLLLLLNLAVIWGLIVLYFRVCPDQVAALIMFVGELEAETTAVYHQLEDNAWRRRFTDRDLAKLNRQKRVLRWKLRALIVFLAFIHLPFAFVKFLQGLFSKKENNDS